MSDNCILKLSVETEDEKYLAVVIPQVKLNCFLWFVCATSLLARNFLLRNLMIFKCLRSREHTDHFPSYREIPRLSKSHRITRELATIICKTPVHLPQRRTNAASLILIFEIVTACQVMVLWDTWFDFSEKHRATKSSALHTAVGHHRW